MRDAAVEIKQVPEKMTQEIETMYKGKVKELKEKIRKMGEDQSKNLKEIDTKHQEKIQTLEKTINKLKQEVEDSEKN